jgi:hypothetical protein
MTFRSDTRLLTPALLCLSLCLMQCAQPTDPESLRPSTGGYHVLSTLSTQGFAQDVVVSDTLAMLAQGEGGVFIASIADPFHPGLVSVAKDEIRGYSYKLAVKDSTVFVASGDFGVNVVSIADPRFPYATATSLNIKPARAFHIMGDYLFTAVSEAGVKISEISYPPQPDVRGGLQTPGYARALTTTPDSALLIVACGEMGLALYDIRDLQGGFGTYRLWGWLDTPGYVEDVALLGTQDIALLAAGPAGLIIVDFSDSSNIRIVGASATTGTSRAIAYRDGKAYLAADRGGLQIFAVDQPASPRLIGTVETTLAYGVALDSHNIYVADRTEGLIIITGPAGTP